MYLHKTRKVPVSRAVQELKNRFTALGREAPRTKVYETLFAEQKKRAASWKDGLEVRDQSGSPQ